MAAHHVIAMSARRKGAAQEGGEEGLPVQAGHLVQCNAPVTFNYVNHMAMGIPQPADMRPLKKPVKRCCPGLVAKSVAAAILGSIAVMAAVLIAMHFLEPSMTDTGPAAEKAPGDHAPALGSVLASGVAGRDPASSVLALAPRTVPANGTMGRDPAHNDLPPTTRRTVPANGLVDEDPSHSNMAPAIRSSTANFMAGGDAATTASTKISSHENASCEPLGEILPCRLPGDGSSEECPRFYSRVQWGARPPNKRVPMIQPIRYVVVSHTAQSRCHTLASCSRLIRSMQEYHLSLRYDDLAYSFLVSDDGSVYEGRGWGRASSHLGDRGNTALGLAFMGNYRRAELTVRQSRSAALLLDHGTRCSYLSTDYLLVAHNQTRLTLSPGEFVFREIRGWPHYSDIRLF